MLPQSRAQKWLVSLYRKLLRRMRAHVRLYTRSARKQAAGLLRCHIELLHPRYMMSFSPSGGEFVLNETTTDTQLGVAAVVDSSGTVTAVWQSDNQDGAGWEIYGRQFNASGTPLGPEFRVNQTIVGDQTTPSIALSTNGDIVVAWTSTQSGQNEIYARTFNSSGVALKNELLVNSIDGSNPIEPTVAMGSDGSFVVAWEASDSADADGIYFRQVDSGYHTKSSDKLVNSTTAGTQAKASISIAPNRDFVIAWADQGTASSKIRAQRFKADGKLTGGEFLVGVAGSGVEDKPSVGMDGSGNFAIAWQANYNTGTSIDVDVRRYSAAGAVLDANPILVNTTINGAQNDASLAMRSDGKFLIAYTTGLDADGQGNGVYAQGFNADGTKDGGEFLVNTTTQNNQKQSAVAWNGNFVAITWEGNGVGDTSGVFAQQYTTSGATANVAPSVAVPVSQTVAEDGSLTISSAGGNPITLSDLDGGAATERLTLSSTHGILTLAQTAGLSFTAGASGTSSMTVSGSVAALNAALDGLVFTPAANYSGAAAISVTLNDLGNSGTGGALSSAATLGVTVTAVADTPTISNATTTSGNQTTSGLVISRNAADGAEVGYYKITAISNGTLYQNNGSTQIVVGQFITAAQGAAGLKFTSSSGSDGSVSVQASPTNSNAGLGGSVATATINITGSLTNHLPPVQVTQDGTPLIFSQATGNPIFISDGSPTPPYTFDLSVNHGTLTLGSTAGISFNSGNGINDTSMSFQGSIAQINAALNGLTFTPTPGYVGTATLQTDTTDGGVLLGLLANSTSANLSITIQRIAHTPNVTGATTNENDQTSSGLVITANAADTSASPHFKITNIVGGTLFQNDGVTQIAEGDFITVAVGAAGLKFTPTPGSAAGGSFDVQTSLTANDSGLGGSVVTANIVVNDIPVIITSGTDVHFTEGDGPVAVDAGLTVSDADDANLSSATVRLFGHVAGQDSLTFVNQSGITGSWNNTTGILTLTGVATTAQYQTALQSITYQNTSTNPAPTARSVEFTINDGAAQSAPVTVGIQVAARPQTPAVTGTTTNESEQSTSGLVITPASTDNADVASFKITNITGGSLFKADGTTAINDGDFITLAEGAAGLRFTPGSAADGSFDAQGSISGDDSGLGGSAATAAITVNSLPLATSTAPDLDVTENDPPAPIDPTIVLTDVDNTQFTGATVHLTGYAAGEDTLVFVDQNGITGSWDSTAGTLTLSGSSGIANYQTAIRSVMYQNTSDDPSTAARSAEIIVSDGVGTTAPVVVAINVTAVDDAPFISVPAGQTTVEDVDLVYSAADGNPIVLTDVDYTGGIEIVKLKATHGRLTLATTNNLDFTHSDGANDKTITLAGTLADINVALDGLSFSPNSDFDGTAFLEVSLGDHIANWTWSSHGNWWGGNQQYTVQGTIAIDVSPAADTPTVSNAITAPGVQTSRGLVIQANWDDDWSSTWFKITNITDGSLFHHDGVTPINNGDFINVATGYNGLRFTPNAGVPGGGFDVQASTTSDDTGLGGGVVRAHVDIDDLPIVMLDPGDVTYTEGNPPVAPLADVRLTDTDDTSFYGATVSFGAGYQRGQDLLQFTHRNGISGQWNDANGVLTLTGHTTVSKYQAALRSITYANSSLDPSEVDRRLDVTVNDGRSDSVMASRTLHVIAVNTAPTTDVPTAIQTTVGERPIVFSTATGNQIYIADADARGASIRVLLRSRHGQVVLPRIDGLTMSIGTGAGDAMVEFSGMIPNVNAALNGLTFISRGYSGPASLQVTVNDLGNSGVGGERIVDSTIQINVQPAPIVQPVPTPAATPTPTPTPTITPTSTPTATVAPAGETHVTPPPSSGSTSSSAPPPAATESSDHDGTASRDRSKGHGGNSAGSVNASAPGGLPAKAVSPAGAREDGALNEFSARGVAAAHEQSLVIATSDDRTEARIRSQLLLDHGNIKASDWDLMRAARSQLTASPAVLATSSPMWLALDQMHGSMMSEKDIRVVAGTASFVSVGMSVAYFFWAVRAGSMLSSLVSSIPAWKSVDPLPILDQMGNGEEEDTEGLDTLVGNNRKRVRSKIFIKDDGSGT